VSPVLINYVSVNFTSFKTVSYFSIMLSYCYYCYYCYYC